LVAVSGDVPGVNRANDGNVSLASARTNTLEDSTHPHGKQYAKALEGTHGDRDAAAAAFEAISKAPGYKPDQEISVVQGRNGQWIATQGQGDAALNVPVPQPQPGDFERVAASKAAEQPTQVAAVPPEQQERARTV
jgi:hypothetical protein